MQTFLPYPDFAKSAAVLDRSRLGKQRVETLQLIRVLLGLTPGWQHHPAARMWRGHAGALCDYGEAICAEWTGRGYRDNCTAKLQAFRLTLPAESFTLPAWLGDERVHRSHRACLKAKNGRHYAAFPEAPTPPAPGQPWPYYWPVGDAAQEGG